MERELGRFAQAIRLRCLEMIRNASGAHIGSCFSCADILAFLYGRELRIDPLKPLDDERDRFIMSKGHAAAILYATLAERGFFSADLLRGYCGAGSPLTGHVNSLVAGVEISTGSLGHGLPIACGIALAGQRSKRAYRTIVLLSDGELDEGSNWEAILFAAHHKLNNLIAIVDFNKIQSFGSVADVITLDPLKAKFEAFGWASMEIDGHDFEALERAFRSEGHVRPTAIIAHTVKGKGVSFMENELLWHYRSPSGEQYEAARTELSFESRRPPR